VDDFVELRRGWSLIELVEISGDQCSMISRRRGFGPNANKSHESRETTRNRTTRRSRWHRRSRRSRSSCRRDFAWSWSPANRSFASRRACAGMSAGGCSCVSCRGSTSMGCEKGDRSDRSNFPERPGRCFAEIVRSPFSVFFSSFSVEFHDEESPLCRHILSSVDRDRIRHSGDVVAGRVCRVVFAGSEFGSAVSVFGRRSAAVADSQTGGAARDFNLK